jgi:branched-chain amino acid transport system permease protein
MIIMPLLLVLVMIYWPRGIMGKREFRGFVPRRDKEAHRPGLIGKDGTAHGVADSE